MGDSAGGDAGYPKKGEYGDRSYEFSARKTNFCWENY